MMTLNLWKPESASGARAIVIKTHQGTTVDRAYLCNRHNELVHHGDNDFTMFGSITSEPANRRNQSDVL